MGLIGMELRIFTTLWVGGGGVGNRQGPSAQIAETGAGGKPIAMSQGHQTSGAGFWPIS